MPTIVASALPLRKMRFLVAEIWVISVAQALYDNKANSAKRTVIHERTEIMRFI
jgi:hypothetical protein